MKTFTSRSRRAVVVHLGLATFAIAVAATFALSACMRDSDEAPRPGGAGLVTRIAHDVADAAIDAAP